MPLDVRMVRPPARPLPVAAVLFDLDGTLADSAGDLAYALNRLRDERGLAPLPVERLRPHASAGARGLIGAGLWLTVASRQRVVEGRREAMTEAEARSVLGVPADATPEAVQAAWRRLMARAHPDQGGTEGLAARVNAARDRLLKR